MIGVIPNPKKSLQIEKPISDVKAAIEYLYLYTTKYKMYYQSRTSVPQGGGGGGFGGGGGRGMGGGFFGTPPATVQGYLDPAYELDISIKKNSSRTRQHPSLKLFRYIWNKKLHNPLRNRFFYSKFSTVRDPQFVRLNFIYKFGKFDASLFKRKNTQNNGDINQDMQQGN